VFRKAVVLRNTAGSINIGNRRTIPLGNEIVLSAEGIVKQFPGTLALNKVHLEVRKGECNALVGENGAGKSTLMNIISGVHKPDAGKVVFRGKEVSFNSPTDAQRAGIGFVHQEVCVCPHLSVSENIFMGRLPKTRIGAIDKKKLYRDTKKLLDLFNMGFSPDATVGRLSTAEQQIVEIAKALSLDCQLIIFDEPTSSLTEAETETLFDIIDDIKSQGISVLYISHRLPEIFRLCENCTVLKDGNYVDTVQTKNVSSEDIIRMMVGRNIDNLYPKKSQSIGETVFEVRNFNSPGLFENISFDMKEGEILGFYGLVGAGRTELWRAILGIDPYESGEVFYLGERKHITNYKDAIKEGFAYLTEDRKLQGLFLELPINQNITAAKLANILRGAIIDRAKETALSQKYINELNIKVASQQYKASSLSGGNQQKVMIGKWLATDPRLLVMDEPTRGIDVGAKSEIHNMLRNLSNSGIHVVIISSELPEIIGMSDRVIVMHEGRITGDVPCENMCEEVIITHASNEKVYQ
jgi:ribose transport system ATP-binding protein